MEYIPEIIEKEAEGAYRHFEERLSLFRKKGLDFEAYRTFIIGKLSPIIGNILEIGTGTGYTALLLAKAGYKFTSIDTDKEAINTTARRLSYDKVLEKAKFYIMDAENLKFENAEFDNVIAINVLHHVSGIDKLLVEADRVLSTAGKVLISDFNEEGRKIIDAVHNEEGRSHDHPIADYKTIRSFFDRKGYKVEEFEGMGHWTMIGEKGETDD